MPVQRLSPDRWPSMRLRRHPRKGPAIAVQVELAALSIYSTRQQTRSFHHSAIDRDTAFARKRHGLLYLLPVLQ